MGSGGVILFQMEGVIDWTKGCGGWFDSLIDNRNCWGNSRTSSSSSAESKFDCGAPHLRFSKCLTRFAKSTHRWRRRNISSISNCPRSSSVLVSDLCNLLFLWLIRTINPSPPRQFCWIRRATADPGEYLQDNQPGRIWPFYIKSNKKLEGNLFHFLGLWMERSRCLGQHSKVGNDKAINWLLFYV